MRAERAKSHDDMIKELEEERLLNVDESEEERLKNLGYYQTAKLSPETELLEEPEKRDPESYVTKPLDAGELRKIINEDGPKSKQTKSIDNPEDLNQLKEAIADLNKKDSKNYNPGLWRTVVKQFRDFLKGKE